MRNKVLFEIAERLNPREVLLLMDVKNYTSTFNAATLTTIMELENTKEAGAKLTSVQTMVNRLVLVGFLKEGSKSGRADTYYITEDGLNILDKIFS